MWRRLITEQRGSLAPVAIFIFLCVALLSAFVLDREWVNYRLRLIEQTADFAAEAGAQYFDVYYNVRIYRESRQIRYFWECDEWAVDEEGRYLTDPWGNRICSWWVEIPYVYHLSDSRDLYGTKEALEVQWRGMAECGDDVWYPNWRCARWEVLDPSAGSLAFRRDGIDTAREVFRANLPRHARPQLLDPEPTVIAHAGDRTMYVSVRAELGSLFGWGRREVFVTGRAVSQYEPLRLHM